MLGKLGFTYRTPYIMSVIKMKNARACEIINKTKDKTKKGQ